MRSGHTYNVSSPTDTVLATRVAQQASTAACTVDTFGLINRGSQGSTGMVGGSAQADDAVTQVDRRKATGCSGDALFFDPGEVAVALPPSRQCATRPADSSAQQPRLDTVSVGEAASAPTTSRWNCSLDTPGGRRTPP
jgi:hypothetical protein